MRFAALKVGELAKRTGLTVRTLHHYDEIGLLKPSLKTEAGHRLYTAGDVARLQQVLSLRQLGFSLEQVRDCLDRPGFSPLQVIGLHVARLREQIELQQRLCDRLEAIAAHLSAAGEVSADEFIRTIEEMTMIENYYTAEQMEYLKKRREEVGEERMQQAPADWAELIAQVRAEMEKGTDPTTPQVQVAGEALAGPDQRVHRRRPRHLKIAGPVVERARRQHRGPARHRVRPAGCVRVHRSSDRHRESLALKMSSRSSPNHRALRARRKRIA